MLIDNRDNLKRSCKKKNGNVKSVQWIFAVSCEKGDENDKVSGFREQKKQHSPSPKGSKSSSRVGKAAAVL